MNGATFAADLMKLLRSQELASEDVAIDMGCSRPTARDWLNEFTEQGILERRDGPPGGGRIPKVYTLAAMWGGQK
jgi:predicted ArsR family transcriptional regulator